jgi:integrase
MPLTDAAVKSLKSKEKAYKVTDGNGLLINVHPNGSKYWQMNYRFVGKQKTISFGTYPDTSLKAARKQCEEARQAIRSSIDPLEQRKEAKQGQLQAGADSFAEIASEWHSKQSPRWSEAHSTKNLWIIQQLTPWIGKKTIGDIKPVELLAALRKIESRGAHETARRTKQVAGQIFRYAVATGRAERDPSQDLKGALTPPKTTHRAAVTEIKDIPPLLSAIDGYQGTYIVCCALRLAPLTFVRPGELRQAEWKDIDLDNGEWRFHVTKTDVSHLVPLSKQAISILRDIEPLTGQGRYVFPSARSNPNHPRNQRPMSENAVNNAFRTMGISKDQMCGHGFRAMARTVLDEVLGYRIEWIEQQLAHAVKDVHGRAYNRTAHLGQRKEMMQGWANYLDELRALGNSKNVIAADFRQA